MKLTQLISAVVILVFVAGCGLHRRGIGEPSGTARLNAAIEHHRISASRVQLGDSKEEVRSILDPGDSQLPTGMSRPSEAFIKDGKKVEILYYRSAWTSDGLMTDDEYTPYVFENGRLVAIGWTTLGGPKNVAQRDQRSITTIRNSNSTWVVVEPD